MCTFWTRSSSNLTGVYIMDKGHYDFERLYRMHLARSFFVIRAKKNLKAKRMYSQKVDKSTGLGCGQAVKLMGKKSVVLYPEKLRRIKFFDKDKPKTYVFLTNNFEIDASAICLLYKNRWQIELFFKCIKQHLKIKKFWGQSENAVKTQIWIAVCTYLLVAIMKKNPPAGRAGMKIGQSLYEILQILSVSTFDKTPVNQLFSANGLQKIENEDPNQLNMFDL